MKLLSCAPLHLGKRKAFVSIFMKWDKIKLVLCWLNQQSIEYVLRKFRGEQFNYLAEILHVPQLSLNMSGLGNTQQTL